MPAGQDAQFGERYLRFKREDRRDGAATYEVGRPIQRSVRTDYESRRVARRAVKRKIVELILGPNTGGRGGRGQRKYGAISAGSPIRGYPV